MLYSGVAFTERQFPKKGSPKMISQWGLLDLDRVRISVLLPCLQNILRSGPLHDFVSGNASGFLAMILVTSCTAAQNWKPIHKSLIVERHFITHAWCQVCRNSLSTRGQRMHIFQSIAPICFSFNYLFLWVFPLPHRS